MIGVTVVHYYVYVLADNGVPFYVGKGTGTRAYIHEMIVRGLLSRQSYEFGVTKDYNPYKTRKIKKIIKEGRLIEYSFPFTSEDEKEVFDKEKELILLHGRKGIDKRGILTNRTIGGTGGDCISGLSKERYDEFIQKLSKGQKGRKGSKSFLGKTHTIQVRERIRNANIGNTKGAKPFNLISPDGHVITGINVTKLARELGLNEESMRGLVAGRQNIHRGWRRYDL